MSRSRIQHKRLIEKLIDESKEDPLKDTTETLNRENLKLHKKVRSLIKERSSLQSKLLLAHQILEDYKGTEEIYIERVREKCKRCVINSIRKSM